MYFKVNALLCMKILLHKTHYGVNWWIIFKFFLHNLDLFPSYLNKSQHIYISLIKNCNVSLRILSLPTEGTVIYFNKFCADRNTFISRIFYHQRCNSCIFQSQYIVIMSYICYICLKILFFPIIYFSLSRTTFFNIYTHFVHQKYKRSNTFDFTSKSGNSIADVPWWRGIRPKWRKIRRSEARKPDKMVCGESFPGCIGREENSTIRHVLIQTVSLWWRKEGERKRERERKSVFAANTMESWLEFANKWNLSDPFSLSDI